MIGAFFDMDHTVLTIDTATSWIRWRALRREIGRLELARAMWYGALYKAAVLDLEVLADKLVAELAGQPEAEMVEKAELWRRDTVEGAVAVAARRAIAWHRERGDELVLLTGATQYAAEAVGRLLGFEHVLCSRLEVESGRFTGRLSTRCWGPHKVAMAERFAGEHGLDLARSWFYSDSYNDLPMLSRVGNAIVVNPDVRLRRFARRARWRVEHWS